MLARVYGERTEDLERILAPWVSNTEKTEGMSAHMRHRLSSTFPSPLAILAS